MKKKFVRILILCLVLLTGVLGGCGSKNDEDVSEERVNLKDIPLQDYITLGEYKGFKVKAAPVSVSQKEVDALVMEQVAGSVTAQQGILDRAVKMGDTVNIDYTGTKEGVAFSGGTAQGAILTIGSGAYIAGFEEGLVGVMPGQTVDLNLTFPKEYGNTELAGADVVFSVTVNFIIPEPNDEMVAALGASAYKTLAELEDLAYQYLYENAQYDYDATVENSIMEQLLENCTYNELPENLLKQYQLNALSSVETMASAYGVDAATYVTAFYNMSLADFAVQSAEASAKQALAFQAIAEAEGLVLDEDALSSRIEDYAASNGSTKEALLAQIDIEDFREYFMLEDVMDFLKENAVITED